MKMPDGWNGLRYEDDVRFALGVLCFDVSKHVIVDYEVYVIVGRAPYWGNSPTFTGNLDEVRCFIKGAYIMSRAIKP